MSHPDPSSTATRRYDYSIPTFRTKDSVERRPIGPFAPACLFLLALFLGCGLLLLPLTGFQADEVMFIYDLWHPEAALSTLRLHHHALPTMMMSYLGAFKSWVYAPILGLFGSSVYAVRLPMLLLAAATIWLTGRLLRRIGGTYAAIIGVLLLSTDVIFLLTSVFDWGPVVIQNFFLVFGILSGLRWYETRQDRYAFLTGLVYGVALWNKALFLWNLSGLIIALLCFALRPVLKAWNWRALGLLIAGLCLGAAPLLKYNLQTHGSTLQSTTGLAWSAVGDKGWYFSFAMDGAAAPTANVDLQNGNADHRSHPLSSIGNWTVQNFGPTPSSWRFPVCCAVLLFGLIVASGASRKWILFFLLSGFLGWIQSAITPDAGRSIHHTVLFWINWYAATALAFAAVANWRPKPANYIAAGVAGLLALLGVMTIFVEYGDLLRHSATTPWTDADTALAARLSALGAQNVLTADWGIAAPLAVRAHDKISVTQEEFNLNGGSFDRDAFADCKAPHCYVVSHVPERMMLAKAASTLQLSLAETGFRQANQAVIADTHGTAAFVIAALTSGAPPQAQAALPAPAVSAAPRLLATPEVIISKGEIGRTTLTWQVPANMAIEIHVGAPDGPLFASGKGPGQEQTGFWVKNGTQFFLQDVTNGKSRTAENTVARVMVAVRPQ